MRMIGTCRVGLVDAVNKPLVVKAVAHLKNAPHGDWVLVPAYDAVELSKTQKFKNKSLVFRRNFAKNKVSYKLIGKDKEKVPVVQIRDPPKAVAISWFSCAIYLIWGSFLKGTCRSC
jgi:hypothetical protein